MASRKRVVTPRMLKVLDMADINTTKALGIVWLLKNQLEERLDTDCGKDVDSVMEVLIDLIHGIKDASDDFDNEETIYADTLDEYLAVEKAEREMAEMRSQGKAQ